MPVDPKCHVPCRNDSHITVRARSLSGKKSQSLCNATVFL
jgi:hypothetical protein